MDELKCGTFRVKIQFYCFFSVRRTLNILKMKCYPTNKKSVALRKKRKKIHATPSPAKTLYTKQGEIMLSFCHVQQYNKTW